MMMLLFPLLLLSAATTIHGFQVQPLRSAVTLSNPRLSLTQGSVRVSSPRRSVANESIEQYDGSSLSSWNRLVSSLPRLSPTGKLDKLDKKILQTCIPTMLNLMVVPIVNAVDTFYVGRLRDPLALAAQSAANQCFFTVYFLVAFLPTITAPVVARAIGEKKWDEARDRVCESMFLCNVLGGIGSLILIAFPEQVLRMVLPKSGTSVMAYAVPYLRLRAFGMLPALLSSCGFAAYNGMLNTVTPLKVTLTTNLINMILDPLFIFGIGRGASSTQSSFILSSLQRGFGAAGAAAATSVSETISSLIYVKLLIRRKLVKLTRLLKPPSLKALIPLIQGGLAILLRQATLNVAFVCAARRAQALDPSGVSAAAYGITMQIYSLGVVAHLGIQATAASMVSSARATGGNSAGRETADRIFGYGCLLGLVLAVGQYFLLPTITPLFSPLPEVIEAVKGPAAISSFIHLVNGLVFAGEGALLGLGAYKDLAVITAMGVGCMVSCLLSPLGKSLNGILLSLAAFNLFQGLAVTLHHVRFSPLRRRGFGKR